MGFQVLPGRLPKPGSHTGACKLGRQVSRAIAFGILGRKRLRIVFARETKGDCFVIMLLQMMAFRGRCLQMRRGCCKVQSPKRSGAGQRRLSRPRVAFPPSGRLLGLSTKEGGRLRGALRRRSLPCLALSRDHRTEGTTPSAEAARTGCKCRCSQSDTYWFGRAILQQP